MDDLNTAGATTAGAATSGTATPLRQCLARLAAAVDELAGQEPWRLTEPELAEVLVAAEITGRRLAAVGLAVVAEVDQRGIPTADPTSAPGRPAVPDPCHHRHAHGWRGRLAEGRVTWHPPSATGPDNGPPWTTNADHLPPPAVKDALRALTRRWLHRNPPLRR